MSITVQPGSKSRWIQSDRTLLGVFSVLAGTSLLKGALPSLHVDETYFWFLTYENGFVRRGLVGTLLAPWLHGSAHVTGTLTLMCVVLTVMTVCGVWVVLLGIRQRLGTEVALVCAALAGSSPFLGTLLYHVGYPDGVIALLVLGGTIVITWSSGAAAATLVLASAVHEMAFLMLLPLLALGQACRPQPRRGAVLLGLGALVSVGLVLWCSRPNEATLNHTLASLQAADLTSPMTSTLLHISLTQRPTDAVALMWRLWSTDPLGALMALAYAALPGCLISLTVLSRVRFALAVPFVTACCAPIALLALAWDLSRVAGFTTLTGLMAVWLIGHDAARGDIKPAQAPIVTSIRAAGLAAALLWTAIPILDIHLWVRSAWPVNTARIATVCRPCAQAGFVLSDFFNRGLDAQVRLTLDRDPQFGN